MLTWRAVADVTPLLLQGQGKPKMTSSHRPDMGYKYFGLDEGPMGDAVSGADLKPI